MPEEMDRAALQFHRDTWSRLMTTSAPIRDFRTDADLAGNTEKSLNTPF